MLTEDEREYQGALPWYLRWQLPPDRPMLLLVGRRGSGKTLRACEYGLEAMRQGRRVYANFAITDMRNGLKAGRIHSLYDCLDLTDCLIIVDEASSWVSSRQWSMIPPSVITGWQESRKAKVQFIFTTQHESRVDVIVRELCDWILLCERMPMIPKWVPMFRYRWTYLEEINEARRGATSDVEYRWMPQKVFDAYNTHELIASDQLTRMHEYQRAHKAGEAVSTDDYDLAARIEPMRLVDGLWCDWATPELPDEEEILLIPYKGDE